MDPRLGRVVLLLPGLQNNSLYPREKGSKTKQFFGYFGGLRGHFYVVPACKSTNGRPLFWDKDYVHWGLSWGPQQSMGAVVFVS